MIKVDYSKANQEVRFMEVGEHPAIIKKASLFPNKRIETLKDGSQAEVNYEHINITLENARGEVVFDRIWHQLNEAQTYLIYNEYRFNMYSMAIGIPDGTEFKTINEWLEYIQGKELIAVVIEDTYEKDGEEKKRAKVSYVKEGGMPF